MRPIESAEPALLAGIEGLIFDLDDTLLDHGKLGAESYRALWDLYAAGLSLIAATGRPAGWGEVLARTWPVAAVVSENGAIAHSSTPQGLLQVDAATAAVRRERQQRLAGIAARVEAAFPTLHRTDDAHARISDVTYDIGEHQSVPAAMVKAAAELAQSLGAQTLTSSVHLHLTLDRHDKATGCLAILREQFGLDTTHALMRFAFIGDSGNDAACFAAFRTTIGVANLTGRPTLMPRFVTRAARGAGFAEAARVLLDARK